MIMQDNIQQESCRKKHQVKTFAKNFLSWKPAEFYLRGIKRLDKWQEMIQINGELKFIH